VSVDTAGMGGGGAGAGSPGPGGGKGGGRSCAAGLGGDYLRGGGGGGGAAPPPPCVGGCVSPPRAPRGGGGAPRAAPGGGAAVGVRAKALEIAAELMQQDAGALAVSDGKVVCKGADGPSIALGEIAKALEPTSKLLGERSPGLSAEGWFFSDHMTYPYGVHIALAKVDRETGGVRIERYLLAYDVGRAVNPMLVEGQLARGGAPGGGGGLVLEVFFHARRGAPSVQFVGILVPTPP